MRCVVFELAGGGGTYVPPPPGRAKVAQTPGRARDISPYVGSEVFPLGKHSKQIREKKITFKLEFST